MPEQQGLEQEPGAGWGVCCDNPGRLASALGSFQPAASLLKLGASLCMCSSKVESHFLIALQQAPLVFKPAKGDHSPSATLQDGVPDVRLKPLAPEGGPPSL